METSVNKNKVKVNSAEKLAKLIKENLCVVIKISASWCGPCKNKHFLELYDKLKDNYNGYDSIKFIELDIDADSDIIENKDYFDISIESVPTFYISKKGSFTKKYEGGTHLDSINKYLFESL
jgi:thiol-disulfide isomerase/thioredoxin